MDNKNDRKSGAEMFRRTKGFSIPKRGIIKEGKYGELAIKRDKPDAKKQKAMKNKIYKDHEPCCLIW